MNQPCRSDNDQRRGGSSTLATTDKSSGVRCCKCNNYTHITWTVMFSHLRLRCLTAEELALVKGTYMANEHRKEVRQRERTRRQLPKATALAAAQTSENETLQSPTSIPGALPRVPGAMQSPSSQLRTPRAWPLDATSVSPPEGSQDVLPTTPAVPTHVAPSSQPPPVLLPRPRCLPRQCTPQPSPGHSPKRSSCSRTTRPGSR